MAGVFLGVNESKKTSTVNAAKTHKLLKKLHFCRGIVTFRPLHADVVIISEAKTTIRTHRRVSTLRRGGGGGVKGLKSSDKHIFVARYFRRELFGRTAF